MQMGKSLKELKKENTFLKSKCNKSDVTLIELVEEVIFVLLTGFIFFICLLVAEKKICTIHYFAPFLLHYSSIFCKWCGRTNSHSWISIHTREPPYIDSVPWSLVLFLLRFYRAKIFWVLSIFLQTTCLLPFIMCKTSWIWTSCLRQNNCTSKSSILGSVNTWRNNWRKWRTRKRDWSHCAGLFKQSWRQIQLQVETWIHLKLE